MNHKIAPLPHALTLLAVAASYLCSLPAIAQSIALTTPTPFALEAGEAGALDAEGLSLPAAAADDLPDAPQATQTSIPAAPASTVPDKGQQTKRILFIIPNFRAVSVDEKLPPMTAKDEIKLVFSDSFDYSSFIYVGITAGISYGEGSYPEFHQGAAGYGRYYWHLFADSVGENAFTEFLIPYPTREDPRYYTLGRGGFAKRMLYSTSRLLICRDNNAKNTINLSEIVGAGAAAGVSNLYYPSAYTTWTKTGQKWITQIGIDGLGNIAKEFWPDINAHVFNNKF